MDDTFVVCVGWTAAILIAAGCSSSGQNVPPDMDSGAHDHSDVGTNDVVVGDGGSADAQDGEPAPEADVSETTAPVDAAVACSSGKTSSTLASAARSSGFSGTDTAYYAIFGASCSASGDCAPACVTAGGTTASCQSGSQCLAGTGPDGGLGCVPPTYWLDPTGAFSESGSTASAAQIVLVTEPYHDAILVSDFKLVIPDTAAVTGVQFDVRRASIDGNALDDVVSLSGVASGGGTNHANTDPWPASLTVTTYGGPGDDWGASLTPAILRDASFGISLSATYTGTSSGNEHAYIDSVRLTVFYVSHCD